VIRPFRIETGLVAPLLRADVDTDQIIPKQFLKRVERTGFGAFLFHDWRADPAFVLNQARYDGATILVAGRNFGCGSSREHAAWSLSDAGFRVLIAPSFADIFAANCANNGLLTITLPDEVIVALADRVRLTVDLERCEIRDGESFVTSFVIDALLRERLLHGHDEIAMTLEHEAAIARYEARNTQPSRVS
jgi:3-isopropylmalate/(R)-2-methylmalate dehydratase small subunit